MTQNFFSNATQDNLLNQTTQSRGGPQRHGAPLPRSSQKQLQGGPARSVYASQQFQGRANPGNNLMLLDQTVDHQNPPRSHNNVLDRTTQSTSANENCIKQAESLLQMFKQGTAQQPTSQSTNLPLQKQRLGNTQLASGMNDSAILSQQQYMSQEGRMASTRVPGQTHRQPQPQQSLGVAK